MNPMLPLPLGGRLLIASLFLVAGVRKILFWSTQVAYFAKLGFPAPEVMTAIAVAVELGCAILLVVGWKTREVAKLLAFFVLIATLMAHRFWEFDPAQQANQLNHLLKNLAIIGGLLFVAAFGPGKNSVDKS